MSETNSPGSEMTKSSPPPVLPERKFGRVLRFSRANSLGVMLCAGLSLLLSLAGEAWIFSGFAALALVCGWMEWRGHGMLVARNTGGMTWLIGAQACLYTVIAGYALWRLEHFDAAAYWAEIPPPARENMLGQMAAAGLDAEQDRALLLRTMNFIICVALVGVSTLYQGGLALWYRLQRPAVVVALGAEPEWDGGRGGGAT